MVSSLPRRQRKAHFTASNVLRRKQMAAQVDPKLRERMANRGKKSKAYPRSLPVRKGDRVRVVRGQEYIGNNPPVKIRDPPRGRAHRVTGVNTRNRKIFVEGKTYEKADGSKVPFPIDPSNVVIVNPDWSDPRRRRIISRINKLEGMTDEEYDEWEREEDEFEADEYEAPDEDEEALDDEEAGDAESALDEDVQEGDDEDEEDDAVDEADEADENDAPAAENLDNETDESNPSAGEAVNKKESEEA